MTNKMRGMRCAIAGAFLAAYAANGAALTVDEVEPNSSVAQAQLLEIDASRSVTVSGQLEDGGVDIYSFWAKEGDVVTFDVDGDGSIDTWMTVLLPASALTVGASVDDSTLPVVDPGSSTSLDPYIENYRIPATGVYFVAVTALPNPGVFPYLPVLDGGVLNVAPGNAAGSYTLILSNVSPQETQPDPAPDPAPDPVPPGQVQQISIDVKPGRGMIVRLDPKSRHGIPVALLSSKDFNALSVDVSSLTFGRTGDEESLRKCHGRGIYVNRDRRPDLVCEFGNDMAQFELGDNEGIVRGRTKDGTAFEGRGMLKVIPYKRHRGQHFDGHDRRDDDDDDRRRHRYHWHRR